MIRAKVWLRCAAMHDPVSPVLLSNCRIGWQAKQRNVELEIERPLTGSELLARMKGWVTLDVAAVDEVLSRHGRIKLFDDRQLVVECEDEQDATALQKDLEAAFGDQIDLEIM